MRKSWGGRNLIGISFLLALASCASEIDDSRYVASEAETFAQAQDAAPAISSIFFGSSPARGDTYELGETVVVFVQFDGPVETTDHGEFQVALTIGAETQYATLVGWRSDHRYRFEYTVQEPDRDGDGISIPADAILLNGGAIIAPDGTTDADLTHGAVAADAGRKVNGSLTSPPAVTSIEFVSAPKGNAYAAGEAVEVAVEFDRVVAVTGNPQVALTIGTETRHAAHSAWWRDEYLIFFSYKVQGDDRDEDGISIPANALILNGGTITATDGTTEADLTHAPVGPERDRKVDGGTNITPPRVRAVSFGSSPARGDTYELGETVVVFVQFDGPVEATDQAEFQVALTIGAETQYATYRGRRSDHRYRFEYTVQEPDRDEDGISIPADAILLNGGTLTGPDGTTDADLTHGTVAADAGRKMNGSLTSPPAVTSIEFVSAPKGNAYARGEAVRVAVEFDRVVTVTGNPQVALTIGTETRNAAHSAWWRDEDLIFFSYKVQGDDRDEDGISIPANALILNGGTITATDGTTDADLTHAPVGPERARRVDGSGDVTPPRVKAIVFDTSPARGDTYELGETVKMSVEFDGPVEAGTFQLALTIGTETRYATMFATAIGRHWYYFEYTVQEGDRDEDGISIPANALILISGAVTDPSGTVDADLTHGTVAADAGRKVDGSLISPPAVKRVYLFSSPPTKGDMYGPGETVRVGVRFDRVVTVTGNPQVALTIGTETRHAAYSASFDRSTIAFVYVVQEGDRDEDGISIPANALTLNGGTIKFGADSTIDADLTHAAVARDPTRKVSGSTASP